MRNGGSNIAESYAQIENGELWLVNSYVAPYEQAKIGAIKSGERGNCWRTKKRVLGCGMKPTQRNDAGTFSHVFQSYWESEKLR